jgi:hypothetical protein
MKGELTTSMFWGMLAAIVILVVVALIFFGAKEMIISAFNQLKNGGTYRLPF